MKSTPHLYLSALSWVSRRSRQWNIVSTSFASELPMISNVPEAKKGERWSENVGTAVKGVAYSADGQLFAAGCEDGSVRFWVARSGKRAREPLKTGSEVWCIAISPDNCWLASGHINDNEIRLWDLHAESADPRVLDGHTWHVYSLAFSSDGKRLVSGSGDFTIKVWDVESGTPIGAPFIGHDSYVTSVTFSADDTRIFSGSLDGTVRICNSETGELIGEPLQVKGRYVACSRDGRFIATGSDGGTIILWDAATSERIGDPLADHVGEVTSLCFSVYSRYLASGSNDRTIRIWNVKTRSLICELRGHTDNVNAIAFSPDGRSLLSGSIDGTVRVWVLDTTVPVDHSSASNSVAVLCVLYVPGSDLIASGSEDGSIRLWDAHTGAAVGSPMQEHVREVNALAASNDGRWIVSGSDDMTLRLWGISSRSALGKPMLGHTGRVNSVSVSPDNQYIASASDDSAVRLWDVATRELVTTLGGHEGAVNSVAFSVDGKKIISGSEDCTLRIWEVHTGKAIEEPLRDHSKSVVAVAVSPDGQWFASASYDAVRIWSMSTLKVIHAFGHLFVSYTSVVFSLDSRHVLIGNRVCVDVRNVLTGKIVGGSLFGHTSDVNSVAVSFNSHDFASGSDDGTIRVWDIRARTDLQLLKDCDPDTDHSELSEDDLLIRWNASRACMDEDYGWVRDGGKLLLWVPLQYRSDIRNGTKVVIGAQGVDPVRPEVDYRTLFRYSGKRWTNIYKERG